MRKTSAAGRAYRLVYCSRNIITRDAPEETATSLLESEIRGILLAARRNNAVDGITGALLFTGSGFAQVLEGPREAVERTFERIGADPRHSSVTVLSFTPIERRCFPDWSMGYCGQLPEGAVDPLPELIPETALNRPRVTTGGDVLRLLERVVRREDQWIAA